jgi:hypothetical protein
LSIVEIRWGLVAAASAAVAGAAVLLLLLRRRPADPAEVERRRRERLNRIGRIIEGQILEILDAPVPPPPRLGLFRRRASPPPEPAHDPRILVCYSYAISGVSYEAAQDVTGLEERAVLDRLAAGQVTSVKYDPGNPGNSILVAEHWSGLQ